MPDVADAKENHEYILIEYEQDGETIKSKRFYLFYDGAYHEDRAAGVSLDGYATEQYVDDGLADKATQSSVLALQSTTEDLRLANEGTQAELTQFKSDVAIDLGGITERLDNDETAIADRYTKDEIDTEMAKKGNAIISFDDEYQYLQIRDDNGTDIGFSQETANTVRVQEYAKDDRGQVQKIFDETLTSKAYVDDALDNKQDALESGVNIKTVNGNDITGEGNIQIRSGVGDEYDLTAMPSYNEIAADIADHKLRYIGGNWQVRSIAKEASDITLTAVYSDQKREYKFEMGDPDAPLPEPWTFYDGYTNDSTMRIGVSPEKYVSHRLGNGGFAEYALYDDSIKFRQAQAQGQTPFEKTYTIGTHFEVGVEKWYGTYTDENGETFQAYSKMLYIPALPAVAGVTTYPHGVSGIKQILQIYGFCSNGFVMNAPRQTVTDNITVYQASKSETNKNISIEVGKDRSNLSAYVVMVYAKNN